MAQIIKIDELVPEEIIFQYKDVDYSLPGDIDVDTTFRLQQLLVQLGQAEQAVATAQLERLQAVKEAAVSRAESRLSRALNTQRQATLKVEKEILALFKVNHPDLEKLPFGAAGFQAVLSHVLLMLGFGTFSDEEEEPDPTPAPKRSPRPRTKSPRSSSSKGS